MLTIICWLAMIQAFDAARTLYSLIHETPPSDSCDRP